MKNIYIKKYGIYIFLFLLGLFSLVTLNYITTTLFVFTVIIFWAYKRNIPFFPIFLFAFAFLLRIIIVLCVKTPPQSDFSVMYRASQDILNNDFGFVNTVYFKNWAYQIGFVFYQSILMRICNNILFLKTVNCLLSALTVVTVYLCAKEIAGKKAAVSVSLVYCVLPFSLTLVTVLTNQIPATLLIYLAIYVIISKELKFNLYIRYFLFAVLCVFSNVLRPEGITVILAVVFSLVLTFNKVRFKQNVINILIVTSVYFLLFKIISHIFKVSGLSPLGLTNNAPYWKFVLGLNYETSGTYSSEDTFVLGNAQAAYSLIKERITMPFSKLAILFCRKINSFWFKTTLDWSFGFASGGLELFGKNFDITGICKWLEKSNTFSMVIIYALSALGTLFGIVKKKINYKFLIFANMMLVTFGAYLLIEVQPRYVYNILPAVFILAAVGLSSVSEVMKSKLVAKKGNQI